MAVRCGGGGDGEHTRFPCLEMVRYAVAGAVTVFAAAVVVMAIHFGLRSEDIRLSIRHGYIEADRLWSLVEAHGSDEVPPIVTQSSVAQLDSNVGAVITPELGSAGRGYSPRCGTGNRGRCSNNPRSSSGSDDDISSVILASKKETTSRPAEQVNLRVILSAANPGSRSQVDCHNATVRLRALHEQNLSIGVAPEIFSFELGAFTVPQQTAHTKHQRAAISNNQTLVYIWKNYHGRTSFDVIVQVDANITSYPVWGTTKTVRQTYFCWPVTIGLVPYQTLSRQNDATCLTKEEALLSFELPTAAAVAAPAPTTNGSAI